LKKTQAAQAREKEMVSKQAKTRDTDPDKDGGANEYVKKM
jgi:hypothetical protein